MNFWQIICLVLLFATTIVGWQGCVSEESGESTESPSSNEQEQVKGVPKIDELTKRIEANPADADAYFQRSQAYVAINYLPHAIADLHRAMNADSTQMHFYISLADLFEKMNDVPRSIATVKKALELQPENLELLILSGKYKFYLQLYRESLLELDKALAQSLFNPKVYFLKGMIHKEVGDTVKAITAFQTTVEQNPLHYEGYVQLGLLYGAKKDNLAARYFQNAVKVDSSRSEAWYSLARYQQDNQDFETAKRTYRKLVLIDRQDERVHYNLGFIYFQQDSLRKADNKFNIAIQVAPNYTDAFYMRGLIAEVIEDKPNARYYYEQALSLEPEHDLANQGMKRIQ